MKKYYTNDKGTQIVLSLLKQHGIKKVVASPGTTNIALVASMQYDSWFEMYSSVDERSAAYIACGLAAESQEPVVLSCTGATASRNYFPGLTEAYYRKLPILAITGSHGDESIGNLHAQSLNRTQAPIDTVGMSISINNINSPSEEWAAIVNINKAILELTRRGGTPVHINLRQGHSAGFSTEELPVYRMIKRFFYTNTLPDIKGKRVAIFIGSHKEFSTAETSVIDKFCEVYNGVVFCDHTSGYHGKFKLLSALIATQSNFNNDLFSPDLLIHIGEISGDFYTTAKLSKAKECWRINKDGEIRDLFKSLTSVFEMDEQYFFNYYITNSSRLEQEYFDKCKAYYFGLFDSIPSLPFGNIWVAQQIHDRIPKNSVIHFSIFNSLRSWNFFELDDSVMSNCNVGGFGIDGPISTLIGSSLANPTKLHFGIIGDLAFFYDLNSLGNRHILPNLRLLLINNGKGTEFRNYDHPAAKWGEDADVFMAAGGHYACQSPDLVKHFSQDLGFDYISASSKEDFSLQFEKFISEEIFDKPIIFELFIDSKNESKALRMIRSIMPDDRSFFDKVLKNYHRVTKKLAREFAKELISYGR